MGSRFSSRRSIALLLALLVFAVVGCSRGGASAPAAPVAPGSAAVPPLASGLAPSASAKTPVASAAPTTPPTAIPPTATPLPAIPTAADLAVQTLGGAALTPGGWTTGGVVVSFRAPAVAGEALVPQVEAAPAGQPFTGTPTAQGTASTPANGFVTAQITLKDLAPGQYSWQARFAASESGRTGAWQAFGGDPAFGIVGQPPQIQNAAVQGASHASGGIPIVGPKDQASVSWSANANPAGALADVVYLADHQQSAPAQPPDSVTKLDGAAPTLALTDLADGSWYVHLWAQDKAGQVSAPSTVAVTVLRQPLQVSDVVYRTWATNPLYQSVPIHFTLSRPAAASVTIFGAGSTGVVRRYDLGRQPASQAVSVTWDGRDGQGRVVAPGSYRFMIDAVDDAGFENQAVYSDVTITAKVIKISLGQQTLTAYDGATPLLTTLVTSGGADLPTPTGQFEIIEKSEPFTFHSPYPKGSRFWYADVTSHYAMLFDQPDADFIHDAPWRSVFGPGTNRPGTPGQVYTGSHGCVETPANVMPRLYPWTPMGTPVIISQ